MALALYNPNFAKLQINKFKGTCTTCHRESYSAKRCTRCGIARYCNKTCQGQDFVHHKNICVRISQFEQAKDRIDATLRQEIFQRARYIGISCFLGSLPDRTRYALIGQRVAVVVHIMESTVDESAEIPSCCIVRVRDVINEDANVIFIIKDALQAMQLVFLLGVANFMILLNVPFLVPSTEGKTGNIFVMHVNQVSFII
ncbi:unnamed protein product [Lymnaea stagnalis]|uniref:MYND-type domain-containing protein n=1 Tax=Lymnaea stagnalis TaxID=6523 RepID=A0AAV2HFH3_LYMST